MKYQVGTFRAAGLEAKWSKTSAGQPCIVLRNPEAKTDHQRRKWWLCDNSMFNRMKESGIVEGFEACTIFGDIFSVPA